MITQQLKYQIYHGVLNSLWSGILLLNVCACGQGSDFYTEGRHDSEKCLNTSEDIPDNQGNMDIHSAALKGDISTIKEFLEKLIPGEDKTKAINARNKDGHTALHLACLGKHIEVVKWLLQHGANIDIKNLEEKTAKDLVPNSFDKIGEQIVSLLRKQAEEQEWKSQNLCRACKNGKLEEVKQWIQQGANVNQPNRWNKTPLGIACDEDGQHDGKLGVVQCLIDNGADVNQPTSGLPFCDPTFPLHLACKWKHQEIAKILIKKGANLNEKDQWGATPLYEACRLQETPKLVEHLIEKGADVNLANNERVTPLYVACENGYIKVVQALIKNRADVNIASVWNILTRGYNSPLYIACEKGNIEVVKLLIEANATIDQNAVHAANINKHKELEELLKTALEKIEIEDLNL